MLVVKIPGAPAPQPLSPFIPPIAMLTTTPSPMAPSGDEEEIDKLATVQSPPTQALAPLAQDRMPDPPVAGASGTHHDDNEETDDIVFEYS